jgi:hypothetical protein
MGTYLRFGIVGSYQKKSELWELTKKKSELWKLLKKNQKKLELWEHIYILKFGIVGTYFKNRNYGNI